MSNFDFEIAEYRATLERETNSGLCSIYASLRKLAKGDRFTVSHYNGWFTVTTIWCGATAAMKYRRQAMIENTLAMYRRTLANKERRAVMTTAGCSATYLAYCETVEADHWAARDVPTGYRAAPDCYFL